MPEKVHTTLWILILADVLEECANFSDMCCHFLGAETGRANRRTQQLERTIGHVLPAGEDLTRGVASCARRRDDLALIGICLQPTLRQQLGHSAGEKVHNSCRPCNSSVIQEEGYKVNFTRAPFLHIAFGLEDNVMDCCREQTRPEWISLLNAPGAGQGLTTEEELTVLGVTIIMPRGQVVA